MRYRHQDLWDFEQQWSPTLHASTRYAPSKRLPLSRVSHNPRNGIPKILTASDPGEVTFFNHMFIISMARCNLLSYFCNLSGPVKGFFRLLPDSVTVIHQNRVVLLEVVKCLAYRGNNIRNRRRAMEEIWINGGVLPSRGGEFLPLSFLTPPSSLAELRMSGKPPAALPFCIYRNLPLSHTI
jgi:hypothetical protein